MVPAHAADAQKAKRDRQMLPLRRPRTKRGLVAVHRDVRSVVAGRLPMLEAGS